MHKFFTPGFGDPLPFLLAGSSPVSVRLDGNELVERPHFLGLSRDAQLGLGQGSGWAIQEQVTELVVLSCHCLVGR